MKPPHPTKNTASDPLRLLPPGTADKHAAKPQLPKAFSESLVALERKAVFRNGGEQEIQVGRMNKIPVFRNSVETTESSHLRATEIPPEQPAVPDETEINNFSHILFGTAIPSEVRTNSEAGEIPVRLSSEVRLLPPSAGVTETDDRLSKLNSLAKPVPNNMDQNAQPPVLVTARSTHLPPAQLPLIDGINHPEATSSTKPPGRLERRESAQTERLRPRNAVGPLLDHSTTQHFQTSKPQREPETKPQPVVRSRLPGDKTQPAKQLQDHQPPVASPQPAMQAFSPLAEPGKPLVPERISATVVASALVPDPGAHPVKSLTLQLHPVELGAVTVTVRLKPNEIALRVETESEKTLILLQRDENSLRQVLHAAGYDGEQASLHIVLKSVGEMAPVQLIPPPSPEDAGRNSHSLTGNQPDFSHSDQRQRQPYAQELYSGNSSHDDEPLVSNDRLRRGLFV